MDQATLPAIGALVVGATGLTACWLAMARSLPTITVGWWRRSRAARRSRLVTQPSRRRVVTGASAADRQLGEVRPARHPALRPDVLRRERERLGLAESRRIVEQALADDPKRLADAIERLLAEDRHDASLRRESTGTSR